MLGVVVLASSSCASEMSRTGRSPSFLIIDSITAASGAAAGTFGSQLNSDVLTLKDATVNGVSTKVATIFSDVGQVTLRTGLKNPGTSAAPTTPTTINDVTVTRYRIKFRRSDGREREGIDVPFAFDGGATTTVSNGAVTLGFDLVRHSMKEEPPLSFLRNGGGAGFIYTLAEITFYGHDQAGNEVSVMGTITVNFGDFADP